MGYFPTFKVSTENDDLTGADPNADPRRRGYVGGGEHGINDHLTQDASPDYSPDGRGYKIVNGYEQAGTNAYDTDVARDRTMGAASNNRAAVTLDQGAANQSRALQMNGLGLMGQAARGQAPSRAAALGQSSTENTIRAASAGTAGARGPGASIAAMNGAQIVSANKMGANNAAIGDMRAAEMAKAQSEYAAGAQHVQGQDVSAATTNAQLEAQQRALNEARQQGFEKRGWDVRKTQSQAADEYAREQAAQANARARARQADQAYEDAQIDKSISTFESALMGAAGSDERMKKHIRPLKMDGLSNLMRKVPR